MKKRVYYTKGKGAFFGLTYLYLTPNFTDRKSSKSEKIQLLKPLHSDATSSMRLRSLSVRSDATSFTHKSHKSHRTGIHTTKTPPDKEKNVSMLRVLSNPKVIIALSGTVIGASCQGFLEARLR